MAEHFFLQGMDNTTWTTDLQCLKGGTRGVGLRVEEVAADAMLRRYDLVNSTTSMTQAEVTEHTA